MINYCFHENPRAQVVFKVFYYYYLLIDLFNVTRNSECYYTVKGFGNFIYRKFIKLLFKEIYYYFILKIHTKEQN